MDRSSVGAGAIARGSGLGGARERAAASASDGCGALATRRAEAHLNANSALISAGEESRAGAPRPGDSSRPVAVEGAPRGASLCAAYGAEPHTSTARLSRTAHLVGRWRSGPRMRERQSDIISPTIFEGMGPNARDPPPRAGASRSRRGARRARRRTWPPSRSSRSHQSRLSASTARARRLRLAARSPAARERRVGGGVVIPARGRAVPTWRACHRCVQRTLSATPARLVPSRPPGRRDAPRRTPRTRARPTTRKGCPPVHETRRRLRRLRRRRRSRDARRAGAHPFLPHADIPLTPPSCRFVPTCSQYGMTAFRKFGPAKGFVLTAWRILRCNPWGGRGYDPPAWPPVGLGGTAAPDDY